jgi:lipopolysaccharide/colanic/teichoic acid biosynthesis glycosyltransferase
VPAGHNDMSELHKALLPREYEMQSYPDDQLLDRRLRRVNVSLGGASPVGIGQTARDGSGEGDLHAAMRRLGDIVLSLTLLTLALPLMLVTALLVMLDSPGGVLYRQKRLGLHGREFTLLKFRSMHSGAEACGPVWAAQSDPRITFIGSFIRPTHIDELPQLFNVLRGQMSFIGPRPERPHFVSQLENVLPFYRERMLVKPGLTGWAQVSCPYGASIEDSRMKLSYDLYYVRYRTLRLDLKILLATVPVVLFRRGAR